MATLVNIDVRIADGAWGELVQGSEVRHGRIDRVGNLPNGTAGGAPAFELMGKLDDGSVVILETTWAAMRVALRALEAGWPEDGTS
jgi:hypothetical protein